MQSKHILENFSAVFSQKGLLKSICVSEGIKLLDRFHGSQIKASQYDATADAGIAFKVRFASMTNGFESPIWDTSESSDILGAFTSVLGHSRDLFIP